MQLHSEYRSTYRWHEFTPRSSDVAAVVKKAPQPRLGTVNQNIHFPYENPMVYLYFLDDFMSFSRKKKHPDLAYRSHELFDAALAPPFPTRTILNQERESRVRKQSLASRIGQKRRNNLCTYKHIQV